jgi:hypothetical protein
MCIHTRGPLLPKHPACGRVAVQHPEPPYRSMAEQQACVCVRSSRVDERVCVQSLLHFGRRRTDHQDTCPDLVRKQGPIVLSMYYRHRCLRTVVCVVTASRSSARQPSGGWRTARPRVYGY